MTVTDVPGRFGEYGGRYVPEVLVAALEELEEAYPRIAQSAEFTAELDGLLATYAGRPTPLTFARRMTAELGGAKIYLKREDLAHTGAHKVNNVIFRMELLGARVNPVSSGSMTLKDAINEAMRDWVTNIRGTYYCIGSVNGPHPYPTMVRDFQRVIGVEARQQMLDAEGRLPDVLVACIGGGSNAIGLFRPFIDDDSVQMVGVEAAGEGLESGRHGAALNAGAAGVLHGMRSLVLSDDDGQIFEAHSISAGLDYPGVGPEHAYLRDSGRATYVTADDESALDGFVYLSRLEGIIPALESAHAIAHARILAPTLPSDAMSGRGDKDAPLVRDLLAARRSGSH